MTRRLNIVKMTILTNSLYRFSVIPIKISIPVNFNCFSWKNGQSEPEIYMEIQWPRIDKTILKNKNEFGGLTLSGFKTYN